MPASSESTARTEGTATPESPDPLEVSLLSDTLRETIIDEWAADHHESETFSIDSGCADRGRFGLRHGGGPVSVLDGVGAIAAERSQQTAGDVAVKPQMLIDAALAYTVQAQDRLSEADGEGVGADGPDTYWPWDLASFNDSDDELRSLAKAGALLAAAYDAAVTRRTNPPAPEGVNAS